MNKDNKEKIIEMYRKLIDSHIQKIVSNAAILKNNKYFKENQTLFNRYAFFLKQSECLVTMKCFIIKIEYKNNFVASYNFILDLSL